MNINKMQIEGISFLVTVVLLLVVSGFSNHDEIDVFGSQSAGTCYQSSSKGNCTGQFPSGPINDCANVVNESDTMNQAGNCGEWRQIGRLPAPDDETKCTTDPKDASIDPEGACVTYSEGHCLWESTPNGKQTTGAPKYKTVCKRDAGIPTGKGKRKVGSGDKC